MGLVTVSKPTILAFGYEARSGKGECCQFLSRMYSASNVLVIGFATALRFEIHQKMRQIMADHHMPSHEALESMCIARGVSYDPFAPKDEHNPFGKQRALQQYWGTEYRRAQNPNYWVDKVAEQIAVKKPDIVLIDDVRFASEAEWVKSMGGYTVHVDRPDKHSLLGSAATHISEHALAGYKFDYKIVNDGSLKQLHYKANQVFHAVTQMKLF